MIPQMCEVDLLGYSELIRHMLALKLHHSTNPQYGVLASLESVLSIDDSAVYHRLIVKAPTATNIFDYCTDNIS
jgi:hypothetical protein